MTSPQPLAAPAPARPLVSDISQWVERFTVMAAIITSRFPDKGHQSSSRTWPQSRGQRGTMRVNSGWHMIDGTEGRPWPEKISIGQSPIPDSTMKAKAKAIPRCTYCLQDDHIAASCPNRPVLNMPLDGAMRLPHFPTTMQAGLESAEQSHCYNEGRCKKLTCYYRHTYQLCGGIQRGTTQGSSG